MDEKRYQMILSSPKMYRDVDLTETIKGVETKELLIGTPVYAHIRMRKQDFPEPFAFYMKIENEIWRIQCPETLYFLDSDLKKNVSKQLVPGDEITFYYSDTNQQILTLYFELDFDYKLKKYDRMIDLEPVKNLRIGYDENCQIRLPDTENRFGTVEISRNGSQYILRRTSGEYGVRLNGQKLRDMVELNLFDYFSIGEYSFCFAEKKLFTDAANDLMYCGVTLCDEKSSISHLVYPQYNRSTRIWTVLPDEKIEILDPPTIPQKPSTSIIMQLFPVLAMMALVFIIRVGINQSGITFVLMSVCSMSVGVVTSVFSIISERRKYKENVKKREISYQKYIEEKRREIEEFRKAEAQILWDKYYSISRELEMVDGFLPNLFERTIEDDDFLEVCLGNGKRKAFRKIEYKKKEKVEALDELQKIPGEIAEEYEVLDDVPVTLKLSDASVIGVSGPREALYHIMKIMTMDLAVRHYYTDVKFIYSMDEKDTRKLKWLRMLPHVQNDALNRRNIICDEESRNKLLEFLYKELSHRSQNDNIPRIIVFIYRNQGIQTHPIMELMHGAKEKGITFVFFHEYPDYLPKGCDFVIQMEDLLHGTKIDCSNGRRKESFAMSVLPDATFSHVVRRIAPIYCEEISLSDTLIKNISFFEMLNIYQPEDIDLRRNWQEAQVHQTLAAPIGVKGKGQIIYLDIHEKAHGPHGLVAGTTGSGKSEILQTYILSIALRYHPYEVGIVIIDFKGGGMANQFRDLPHLVGTITNIDGKEIQRSLLSIRAELKKRQEIFAEYNVNHIDSYIKLYRKGAACQPLPHLILIVDEFAELKANQPDFMKELISAARIGRSLGVHLILATQKPSGVVDSQIWSNSRFRLCLKVQSKEDSNEVLKTPLACEITEAGRAYLQVGNNEIFELFQSAYSGGPAKAEGMNSKKKFRISKVSMAGKRALLYEQRPVKQEQEKETQIISIVNYISEYCGKEGLKRLPYICLPPLPELLRMEKDSERQAEQGALTAHTGIIDDPSKQRQESMKINITTENTMIIGSAQSGKTNLLQVILRSLTQQYTPEELNVYVLDFGTMIFRNYETLQHIGGIVCSYEDEKLKNLFKMLREEVKSRKERLADVRVSSYAAYLEAGFRGMPQIVVMIDNLTVMREMYLMEDDFLLPLCRDGIAVGITFVIANSQIAGIGYKYLTNFERRIAFYCNNTSEYNTLFDGCRIKPQNIPGRCIVEYHKTIYEAQTYLAFEGEKEVERIGKIMEYINNRNSKFPDMFSKKIPVVPESLTDELLKRDFNCASTRDSFVYGIDFESISPVRIDWMQQGYLAIVGKDVLGRSDFVRHIIEYAVSFDTQIYVMDDILGSLAYCSRDDRVQMYSRSPEDIFDIFAELQMYLSDRYKRFAEGNKEYINNAPVLLLILQNMEVLQKIAGDKELMNFYKDMLSKYKGQKICILFANLENAPLGFNVPETLKMIKNNMKCLVFENADNIKVADLSISSKKKYQKVLKKGEAYLFTEGSLSKVKVLS